MLEGSRLGRVVGKTRAAHGGSVGWDRKEVMREKVEWWGEKCWKLKESGGEKFNEI